MSRIADLVASAPVVNRRRQPTPVATGEPTGHVPVLLTEVLEALDAKRGGTFVDGTFGAGGYTKALLDAEPLNRVIAVDRDPDAIAAGEPLVAAAHGRLVLAPGRFGELDGIAQGLGIASADGVVLDIGVSSMQLDQAERGFSFRHDGPLDMRMERDGPSAADIVNGAPEAELADIFYHYGEERRARAVARAIVETRRRAPIATTRELADLAAGLIRAEPGGAHPATRVFQALRIAVNDELGELVRALHAAERLLGVGGRLAVVTFHSLEDRIVKQFFAARTGRTPGASRHVPSAGSGSKPSLAAVTRGPMTASDAEVAANPRSRSAKLRVAERTDAPLPPPLESVLALAELPATAEKGRGRR
jgi:16S rRNA (cytosine1402-N4)-methyltransferase